MLKVKFNIEISVFAMEVIMADLYSQGFIIENLTITEND